MEGIQGKIFVYLGYQKKRERPRGTRGFAEVESVRKTRGDRFVSLLSMVAFALFKEICGYV
jgi:hypothetical protein